MLSIPAILRSLLRGIRRSDPLNDDIGIAVAALMMSILVMTDSERPSAHEVGRVGITVVFITVCCMLACIVPTRRALGIQPTEALKDEG